MRTGRSQAISTFVEGEFPLSVAVGVDRSWSMAGDASCRREGRCAHAARASCGPPIRRWSWRSGGAVETVAPLSVRSAGAGGRGRSPRPLEHDRPARRGDRGHRPRAGGHRPPRAGAVVRQQRPVQPRRCERRARARAPRRRDGVPGRAWPRALRSVRGAGRPDGRTILPGAGSRTRSRRRARTIARELRTQYLIGVFAVTAAYRGCRRMAVDPRRGTCARGPGTGARRLRQSVNAIHPASRRRLRRGRSATSQSGTRPDSRRNTTGRTGAVFLQQAAIESSEPVPLLMSDQQRHRSADQLPHRARAPRRQGGRPASAGDAVPLRAEAGAHGRSARQFAGRARRR